MCIPLAQDPSNVLWSVSVSDDGLLHSTSVPRTTGFGPPIINDGINTWGVSIDIQGRIVITSGFTSSNTGYEVLSYFMGTNTFLTVNASSQQRLTTSLPQGAVPLDLPPALINVSRSNWPSTTPIFCNTCGQANVTEMADLGNWCCTCATFVLPEDCTTIRTIDE